MAKAGDSLSAKRVKTPTADLKGVEALPDSIESPPNVVSVRDAPPLTSVADAATSPTRVAERSAGRERLILLAKLLVIAGCLYLFIVGIGAMGHSFKLFGKGFSEQLLQTTASPFVGLFIGILATAIVVTAIVSGQVTDLKSGDAAAVALYARFLKHIAAHLRSIVPSLVNPFPRLRYKEKPSED